MENTEIIVLQNKEILSDKKIKTWSKWTEIEEAKLKAIIKSREKSSITEICLEFPNKSFHSVKGKIKTMGLKTTENKNWLPEEDLILKEYYICSKSVNDIIDLLPGRKYNAIKARANFLGLVRYIDPTMDETFFDIPNELNCYWAGFIAADGNISDEKYNRRLTINISQKDLNHLERFKTDTKFTGKIYLNEYTQKINFYRNGKHFFSDAESKFCRIMAYCRKWADDLLKHWNITPRKTHTLQPPNLTDLKLQLSYIVGLIDGDGYINKFHDKKDDNYEYSFGVMGTYELMIWIKKILEYILPKTEDKTIRSTGSENIGEIRVRGSDLYWIGKIYLSLDIPRLDRKWGKIKEWIGLVESGNISNRMRTEISNRQPSEEILKLFNL